MVGGFTGEVASFYARYRRGYPPAHAGVMVGGFTGEVASFYARYRRGYPSAFTALLASALRLDADAVVADIGCGTGQLTIPLAGLARAVVGMDPEPDMLALAARAGYRLTRVGAPRSDTPVATFVPHRR